MPVVSRVVFMPSDCGPGTGILTGLSLTPLPSPVPDRCRPLPPTACVTYGVRLISFVQVSELPSVNVQDYSLVLDLIGSLDDVRFLLHPDLIRCCL